MATVNDTLGSLLMDVALQGSAIIDKRKILWMMGRSQDRASAWEILIDTWEEMGMPEEELLGCEVFGNIVLLRNAGTPIQKVSEWAGR